MNSAATELLPSEQGEGAPASPSAPSCRAFPCSLHSEMYRIAPEADGQFGRNDKPKLGYFVFHVHEREHICELVRTHGAVVEAGNRSWSGTVTV